MSVWDYLNSPLISILLGSLAVAWITAVWQKRSQHYEIKLRYAQEIINAYQEYVRLLRSEKITADELSKVHPKLLSNAKIISYIFRDKRIGKNWVTIAGRLSNIYGMKKQGKQKLLVIEKFEEIYDDASATIELMFKELT